MGNTFLAKYYLKKTKEMSEVRLHHEDAKGSFHVIAAKAAWESGPRGSGWRLFTGKLYTYDTGGRLIRRDNSLFTTLPKEGFFISSDLLPATLESMRAAAAYHSIGDLARQYQKNKTHHHLKVEIHVRLAYPVTFLVLLLIGLPCVLIPETKNIFLGVGLCLLVCLLYIVVFVFFTEIGNRGTVTAMAAAWMPLVLFGSLGITLFDAIRT
jgi:lipopolysaccharide export LptBFGC system permease protein LptF